MTEPRARITHKVKCWPEFFQPMLNGLKKFDLRRNDRDYQVGDELLEQEWKPNLGLPGMPDVAEHGYTGREVLVRVDYIMDDAHRFGVDPDYVIMSVSLIP